LIKLKPTFNLDKVFLKVFGSSPDFIAKKVVISPFISPDRFKLHFKKETVKEFSGELYRGVTGRFYNGLITFIKTGPGRVLLKDCLFFLSHAGVKEMLFLGSAGGLRDLKIGDLLLSLRATPHKDFSSYSLSDGDYSRKLKDYFLSIGRKSQVFLKEGKVFTLSSLFEQNQAFLRRLEKSGFSGLDLELSHFFQAATISKIKAAGLCAISDLPLKRPLGEVDKKGKKLLLNSLNYAIINVLNFLIRE